MQNILEQAKVLNPWLVEHRRHLHRHPEVGTHMPLAYEYVTAQLESLGYAPRRIGSHGVVAVAGGKKPGKVFLLRADMDALPMTEETGLPFAADNGCMHACGHDCHAAMLLGAARLLKEREDEIAGTVKLFFQTGEEVLQGAREAVEDGLLQNPPVDAAMMIHVTSKNQEADGRFMVPGAGPAYSSADWFEIHITGKGGHGASPHTTISAINIAAAINTAIQELMAVVAPPSEHAVMTVCQIHSGDTSNIIPEKAFMSGTIRTYNEEVRSLLKARLESCVRLIAQARGGRAEVTFANSTPAVVNDAALRQELLEGLSAALGGDRLIDLSVLPDGGRAGGSEDFAYIARQVPGMALWLTAGREAEGYVYPGHNPRTDFNEAVLYVGAAGYTAAALHWLQKHAR